MKAAMKVANKKAKYIREEMLLEIDGVAVSVIASNKVAEKKVKKEAKKEEAKKEEAKKEDEEIIKLKESDNEEEEVVDNMKKNLEKNDISDNIFKEIKNNNTKSIGMVMYMPTSAYSDNDEENEKKHIEDCEAPSILAKILKKIFEKLYKMEIVELIMGHEHGEQNRKCHLQIIIIFEKVFRKIITPGVLRIEYEGKKIDLLYMQQKARNTNALKNYCKKERDATVIKGEEMEKFEFGESMDPYQYIVDNRENLTLAEGRELLFKKPGDYFKCSANMELALKNIIIEKPPVPFSWMPVPEHLKNYYLSGGFTFYDIFSNWYNMYCINGERYDRKKALCLFSTKRSMGKSYFVRHLVSHKDYILEFNNTFCQKKNLNKGVHKLLLLDDMHFNLNDIEMWKSLVASEPTTLRAAWLNEPLTERLPCIITTNDFNLIKIFHSSDKFATQVLIIEIENYMGEPGTEREDLNKYEFYLSHKTAAKLNRLENK